MQSDPFDSPCSLRVIVSERVKRANRTMKNGFTLLELMLVVLISTFLFGAALTVLVTSDRSWRVGQRKLTEQQEARRAVDSMATLLRQANPDWVISGIHYPVSITANNRIDFYQPEFDANGSITTLKKITFKLNPDNPKQLLKKEGTAAAVAIANNVESISFGGGCLDCTAFTCSDVANNCPVVAINVQTKDEAGFLLSSKITLRNTHIALGGGTEVEQPQEGEF